ncbi:phage tail protein [Acidovorax sp. Leaf76]|uniref:phage tail protein n=1 Tax=unclassified Acidovorax TaxID=2684926 RepID=UPI0006FF152F|nr:MULTISPECIES: tail fiber protein [unclassified Acidovorax]KQO26754.1 phage tail protein [Acidovorax sp. Leaf76]KQO40523.1 phage tail protein [Acidovorax sp. Leaf84]KQS42666.1 phage tail protein [Acidovorax sp. Leaf191]
MDQFIGEIRAFPFSFAPKDWALCNGQVLPITSNTALFSILGTTYGGDGKTTFGLPDLQGRVIVSPGQSPGLSQWFWGEIAGSDSVTLLSTEMPMHNHQITGMNNIGTLPAPDSNSYLSRDARGGSGVIQYMQTGGTPSAPMAPNTLLPSGGTTPHENRQPFLVLNYCIALRGEFPARN